MLLIGLESSEEEDVCVELATKSALGSVLDVAPGTPMAMFPVPLSTESDSDRARGPFSFPSYSSNVDSISVKSTCTSTSERTFPKPTTGASKALILLR